MTNDTSDTNSERTSQVETDANAEAEGEAEAPQLDPSQLEYLRQRLETEQNLPLGVVAGFIAAILGAGVWAAITVATNYQIGFMAIAIGLLVGYAVRTFGKGITSAFGVAGAILSLLGGAIPKCGYRS